MYALVLGESCREQGSFFFGLWPSLVQRDQLPQATVVIFANTRLWYLLTSNTTSNTESNAARKYNKSNKNFLTCGCDKLKVSRFLALYIDKSF